MADLPADRRLDRLRRFAHQLDDSIPIPGTSYRIGYDALVGLIPGVGDVAGFLVSSYIIVEAARFRIPKATLFRMIANVAIETLVGSVPLLGDVFDAAFKANVRNLRLLERRLDQTPRPQTADRLFVAVAILVPLLLVVGLVGLVVYLISLI